MKKRLLILFALATTMSIHPGFSLAATTPTPAKENAQVQDKEEIYGSQLMTQQERTEFRAKMRSAKTIEEQQQFRIEHHKAMQERAAARGITLPDQPVAGGHGMGPGNGMMGQGGGMGSGGGGMGSGKGRGQ